MGKVKGWERALADVCRVWVGKEAVWGVSDCIHFCMACERAITGASVFEAFPEYESEIDGFRKMRGLGFETIPDFIDSHFSRISPLSAQRGDWAMMTVAGVDGFGVVIGSSVHLMTQTGLTAYPVLQADVAWRVG